MCVCVCVFERVTTNTVLGEINIVYSLFRLVIRRKNKSHKFAHLNQCVSRRHLHRQLLKTQRVTIKIRREVDTPHLRPLGVIVHSQLKVVTLLLCVYVHTLCRRTLYPVIWCCDCTRKWRGSNRFSVQTYIVGDFLPFCFCTYFHITQIYCFVYHFVGWNVKAFLQFFGYYLDVVYFSLSVTYDEVYDDDDDDNQVLRRKI